MDAGCLLVFTRLYVRVYTLEFELIETIEKRSIHEHLWRISDVHPSIEDGHTGFTLVCEMKNFFKP